VWFKVRHKLTSLLVLATKHCLAANVSQAVLSNEQTALWLTPLSKYTSIIVGLTMIKSSALQVGCWDNDKKFQQKLNIFI